MKADREAETNWVERGDGFARVDTARSVITLSFLHKLVCVP